MPEGGIRVRPSSLALPALCYAEEIGEGESRGFDPRVEGTDTLFLVRFEGRLYAWRNACPHIDGAPMAWRKDAYMNPAGSYVACHAHGALFAPDTGLCVRGPCLGESLTPLSIEINEEGVVLLRDHSANKILYEEES